MADPTIQTFCCHHGNGSDMAVTIMEQFNTDAYNGVCLFSAALGILGAIYQKNNLQREAWEIIKSNISANASEATETRKTNISAKRTNQSFTPEIKTLAAKKRDAYVTYRSNKTPDEYAKYNDILPREQFVKNHRWTSITAARGRRIIVWLAVADLLASLGVFMRSTLWINYKNIMPAVEDSSSVLFCAISSAWIQYFYTATWIWTLCYTIDMRFVLSDKKCKFKYYHLSAWIIPAFLTTVGLSLLYFPDAKCHQSKSLSTAVLRILPNYIATYIPITLVMIVNPFLYKSSSKDMERVITTLAGQFTSREREIMDTIKIKFSLINIVFYICWVPNLINGVLLWVLWFHLPVKVIIIVWYIMAFVNPLQALFNCMVYRRWNSGSERVVLPWDTVRTLKLTSPIESFRSQTTTVSTREESVPLLEPRSSINGFTEYRRT